MQEYRDFEIGYEGTKFNIKGKTIQRIQMVIDQSQCSGLAYSKEP